MANKENIKKWVSALRSGKYSQTREALHDKSGYCCLGVACETYMEDTGNGEWEWHNSRYTFVNGSRREAAWLPPSVMEWLGVHASDPQVERESGDFAQLSYLNDERELDFDQIATLIENAFLAEK